MNKERVYTLGFPRDEIGVWLGRKKRTWAVGMYNGFGGEIEKGETAKAAMHRELQEETGGAKIVRMDKTGLLTSLFRETGERRSVHLFTIWEWMGKFQETEEMAPCFFSYPDIPYGQLIPGTEEWLKPMLAGKRIHFDVEYDNPEALKIQKTTLSPLV